MTTSAGTVGWALTAAAIGIGAVTVRHHWKAESSLDPTTPSAPTAGISRRLVWRTLDVPAHPATSDATRARGRELFGKYCVECHGPEGKGDGPAARAFSPPPRNFTTGEFRLKSVPSDSLPVPEDLFRSISVGFLATRMPGFSFLPSEDRWALVEQVMDLTRVTNPDYEEPKPGDKPDPDNWKTKSRFEISAPQGPIAWPPAPTQDANAPERGHVVFLREGCNKCHGDEGRGDGPSADAVKDATGALIYPADYTRLPTHTKGGIDPEDLFRTVTTGLASMPAFPQVSAADRWDLAAYVRSRALPEHPETAAQRPEVAIGRELFWQKCSGCHGPTGRGDGPAQTLGFLEVEPRDLTSAIYKWKSTPVGELPSDDDIQRVLMHGVPGTAMPAWQFLSGPERDALVLYLKALAPRFRASGRVPRAPVAVPFAPRDLDNPARVAQGRELFTKWGCTSCHGTSGQGDGPLSTFLQDIWGYPVKPRNLVSAPLHAGEAPEDTFRVLTVGVEGTPMPPFGLVTSEAERYSLVAFVRELRKKGTAR